MKRAETSIDDIFFGGEVSLGGFLDDLIVDFLGELGFMVTVSDEEYSFVLRVFGD